MKKKKTIWPYDKPHMKKDVAFWDVSETESYRVLHTTQVICVCVCVQSNPVLHLMVTKKNRRNGRGLHPSGHPLGVDARLSLE